MQRETGYYWVKLPREEFTVGFYTEFDQLWSMTNGSSKQYLDSDFSEIKNKRILMPDESLPAQINIKEQLEIEFKKYLEIVMDTNEGEIRHISDDYSAGFNKAVELLTCLYAEKMELMGRMAKQLEKIKHGSGTPEKFMETKSLLDEWNKLNQQ